MKKDGNDTDNDKDKSSPWKGDDEDDDDDDDYYDDDDAVNDTKNLWKEASIRVPSLNHRTAGGGSPV